MGIKVFFALVVISRLTIGQGRNVPLAEKREMFKPGECRNVETNSNSVKCVDTCIYDSDCPGLTKCCRVGCGLRCVGGGFFLRLPSDDQVKSQLCPPEKIFAKRPCESHAIFCRSHEECDSKDGICCNDGCDTKCIPRGLLMNSDGVCQSTGWIFHPGELFQKSGCLLCVCYSAKRQKCHHLKNCGADVDHQMIILQDGVETETDSSHFSLSTNSTKPFEVAIMENYVGLDAVLQNGSEAIPEMIQTTVNLTTTLTIPQPTVTSTGIHRKLPPTVKLTTIPDMLQSTFNINQKISPLNVTKPALAGVPHSSVKQTTITEKLQPAVKETTTSNMPHPVV